MSYKIAIASTDGAVIDESFRNAEKFRIIEVNDDGTYKLVEVREFRNEGESEEAAKDCGGSAGCGKGTGCGTGMGCTEASPKLLLVADCRCLICTQIGVKAFKQLEKKAISAFEIDCSIDEAMGKIINYYHKVDNHQSLRGLAKGQK